MEKKLSWSVTRGVRESSPYWYIDFELQGQRAGKARVSRRYSLTTIHNIEVYSEYRGCGIARFFVDSLKKRSRMIVAENVRFSARRFWKHLGFEEEEPGQFFWRNESYRFEQAARLTSIPAFPPL